MLESIDLSLSLDEDTYNAQLIEHQIAMRSLAYRAYAQKRPVVIVYEGWDASGKGGNIKRLTEKLDPRGYTVQAIGAPKGDDATHHYLWRFWRRLPKAGQITIFDRSWYGRVLVERLEGFAGEDEWQRAYREINQLERQLIDFGTIVFKFWIHISKDEQLRRFEARANDKLKNWKLTGEDWRNRDKWDGYHAAVEDMLLKTSTVTAPWTIVEGNSKRYARVRTLKVLVEGLSRELDYNPFETYNEVFKHKNKKKKKKKK